MIVFYIQIIIGREPIPILFSDAGSKNGIHRSISCNIMLLNKFSTPNTLPWSLYITRTSAKTKRGQDLWNFGRVFLRRFEVNQLQPPNWHCIFYLLIWSCIQPFANKLQLHIWFLTSATLVLYSPTTCFAQTTAWHYVNQWWRRNL